MRCTFLGSTVIEGPRGDEVAPPLSQLMGMVDLRLGYRIRRFELEGKYTLSLYIRHRTIPRMYY